MYLRTFFLILFIFASSLFFLSSFHPNLTLNLCGPMCHHTLSLEYIRLTSMIMSIIVFILLVITNYYTEKALRKEQERIKRDRLNIEDIHAELEALKKRD
jgi:uncharacterized membrane protein